MNIIFKSSFVRDGKKIPVTLRNELDKAITLIENANSLNEITNLKKLKGYKTAYRIRINNYRLCILYENETVSLVRFLPRKDVYRFFP
jgi:mRNA interferase RelE/StbE